MRRLVALLTLNIALATPAAKATETQDLAEAARSIDAIPGIDAMLNVCPADLYRTQENRIRRFFAVDTYETHETCRADISACTKSCTTDQQANACLNLGILMELADQNALSARRAHALACALGAPGGCTNRGGGIRNVPLQGDTQSLRWSVATESCLFRTFRDACTDADPWACAMSGQSHQFGEGTSRSMPMARMQYNRACALSDDPNFEGCLFAKDLLESLPPE